jgi:hypothetical protein
MPKEIRPTTLSLFVSIIEKSWPTPPVCVDFGIDSKAHYEAIALPVMNDEITMEQADAALGDGEKLTKLAAEAPSNPHKGIQFQTSWDIILRRYADAPETEQDRSIER